MAPQSFPVIVDMSEAQKKTMRDLNVIVNQLGYRVIEIEQLNPRVREVAGVMICRYRELTQLQVEQMMQRSGDALDAKELYPSTVDGGTILFAESPYPRQMSPGCTGRVAFLLDDEMDTPDGAMSGSKKGWNREFLASHYNDGFWRICDTDIDREVRARAQAIAAKRKEMRMGEYKPSYISPKNRRDMTLITDPDPGVSVPMQNGEPMVVSDGPAAGDNQMASTPAIVPEPNKYEQIIEQQKNTIELLKQRLDALEAPKPVADKGKKTGKKKVTVDPAVEGGIGE